LDHIIIFFISVIVSNFIYFITIKNQSNEHKNTQIIFFQKCISKIKDNNNNIGLVSTLSQNHQG